jgi:hypothetical protein
MRDTSLAARTDDATPADVEPAHQQWHGKQTGYTRHGCRGPKCTAAHAASLADWRRRHAAAVAEAASSAGAE